MRACYTACSNTCSLSDLFSLFSLRYTHQLLFLIIWAGTLDACIDERDAVRREIELAFEHGCIVVPVHFFVARTTDERVKPSWLESRPAGVAVQQHRKACRMWERIYANQGQQSSLHGSHYSYWRGATMCSISPLKASVHYMLSRLH